jgi:hypothetical protein
MRWIEKSYPKNGEQRITKKFLFFPKKIGKETRWLEFAAWVEEYSYFHGEARIYSKDPGCWCPITWDWKTFIIKDVIE